MQKGDGTEPPRPAYRTTSAASPALPTSLYLAPAPARAQLLEAFHILHGTRNQHFKHILAGKIK